MNRHQGRYWLLIIAGLLMSMVPIVAAQSNSASVEGPGYLIKLYASGVDTFNYVPATAQADGAFAEAAVPGATIVVNYLGMGDVSPLSGMPTCLDWDAPALAAFQHAVDIWEAVLVSSVPINVDACWEPLTTLFSSPAILGAAGPTSIFANEPSLPLQDTWYAAAPAEALVGSNLTGSDADVVAGFNAEFSIGNGWWFDFNAPTPSGYVDFTSVVLHELGHGLGFTDFGDDTSLNFFGFPGVYSRYLVTGNGTPLLNRPDGSPELAAALTSNNVYFNGPYTLAVGGAARIYAPRPYANGSSISHLNENSYGGANALMTPFLGFAEQILSISSLTRAMMCDVGWQMCPPLAVVQGPAPIDTTVNLCVDIYGNSNNAIQVSVPGELDMAIHCRVIAQDSTFRRDPAEIGDTAVLSQGVIHAVDVFSPSGESAAGTSVCFQGTGTVYFLSADVSPRVPSVLPATLSGDLTCVVLPGSGTVVLAASSGSGGTSAPAPTPVVAPGLDPNSASSPAVPQALSNCTVTTLYRMNIRQEASDSSAVIDVLPYDTTYTVTEKSGNWYRVIYQDTQGWLNADLVATTGDCG
ncbi:MAG: SH3 domain-containing protein [Anaerolineae bacterium]|nr:SH3 domain-containing protein [Anaerolineae bacterium]